MFTFLGIDEIELSTCYVFFRVYHVKYSFHLYRMSSNHVLRDMFDSSSDDEDELLEDLRELRFLLECRKSLKKSVM